MIYHYIQLGDEYFLEYKKEGIPEFTLQSMYRTHFYKKSYI